MPVVVVNMKDYIFADAITKALTSGEFDFDAQRVYTPDEVMQYGKVASVLILKVTNFSPQYSTKARKALLEKLKAVNPRLKTVWLVDENSEKELADEVRQAKKDGLIDNFIYGSVSASYLSAVIDAL